MLRLNITLVFICLWYYSQSQTTVVQSSDGESSFTVFKDASVALNFKSSEVGVTLNPVYHQLDFKSITKENTWLTDKNLNVGFDLKFKADEGTASLFAEDGLNPQGEFGILLGLDIQKDRCPKGLEDCNERSAKLISIYNRFFLNLAGEAGEYKLYKPLDTDIVDDPIVKESDLGFSLSLGFNRIGGFYTKNFTKAHRIIWGSKLKFTSTNNYDDLDSYEISKGKIVYNSDSTEFQIVTTDKKTGSGPLDEFDVAVPVVNWNNDVLVFPGGWGQKVAVGLSTRSKFKEKQEHDLLGGLYLSKAADGKPQDIIGGIQLQMSDIHNSNSFERISINLIVGYSF